MKFLSTFLPLLIGLCSAIDFDPKDLSNVQDGTTLIAEGLLDYYPVASDDESKRSGWTIGTFQEPYYWWEGGVAWGVMVDWQYLTNQSEHTDMIKTALQYQAGKNGDYMPTNQSLTEGNDDQGFWGLAAMTAAERNFTNPDKNYKGWLYSAQAVFYDMTQRWETQNCDGGLRWQIYTWNSGYNYKNTVSNGCMFALAARLARYTGNSSYADWADRIYDWLVSVDFLDGDKSWAVYDGAGAENNCSEITKIEWTYNSGLMLSAAAYMYDYTNGSSKWEDIASSLWKHGKDRFFQDDIVYEQACQPSGKCNNDQRVFKAIYIQQLGQTASLVSSLADEITSALNATATAAAESCSGGSDGHTCGLNWLEQKWDGMYGLGEQISALAALSYSQVESHPKPFTSFHGGSSNGSSSDDFSLTTDTLLTDDTPVTTGDRAGAGIVTAVLMIFIIGAGCWVII